MSRMRANKVLVRAALSAPDWQERLERLTAQRPQAFVGPLLSCLAPGGTPGARAAAALGACVAGMAREAPEEARVVVRRFLWHMNEESGNLGWGIPESMGETLARSGLLAKEFAHVLFSWIRNTGREDNFVDHAPLRRSCCWAVGRLIRARPEFAARALPPLRDGLRDEDAGCRGMAAWALAQGGVPEELRPELAQLAAHAKNAADSVPFFDGNVVRERTVAELLSAACASCFPPQSAPPAD